MKGIWIGGMCLFIWVFGFSNHTVSATENEILNIVVEGLKHQMGIAKTGVFTYELMNSRFYGRFSEGEIQQHIEKALEMVTRNSDPLNLNPVPTRFLQKYESNLRESYEETNSPAKYKFQYKLFLDDPKLCMKHSLVQREVNGIEIGKHYAQEYYWDGEKSTTIISGELLPKGHCQAEIQGHAEDVDSYNPFYFVYKNTLELLTMNDVGLVVNEDNILTSKITLKAGGFVQLYMDTNKGGNCTLQKCFSSTGDLIEEWLFEDYVSYVEGALWFPNRVTNKMYRQANTEQPYRTRVFTFQKVEFNASLPAETFIPSFKPGTKIKDYRYSPAIETTVSDAILQ